MSVENNEKTMEQQKSGPNISLEDIQKLRHEAFRKKVAENAKSRTEAGTGDNDFDKKMKDLRKQQMEAAKNGNIGLKEELQGIKNMDSGPATTEFVQEEQKNLGANTITEGGSNNIPEKTNETRQMLADMLNGPNPKIVMELIKNGQINKVDYVVVAGEKGQREKGWTVGQARIMAGRAYDVMASLK